MKNQRSLLSVVALLSFLPMPAQGAQPSTSEIQVTIENFLHTCANIKCANIKTYMKHHEIDTLEDVWRELNSPEQESLCKKLMLSDSSISSEEKKQLTELLKKIKQHHTTMLDTAIANSRKQDTPPHAKEHANRGRKDSHRHDQPASSQPGPNNKEYYQKVLKDTTDQYGEDAPQTVDIRLKLRTLYEKDGDYKNASEQVEQVIKILKQCAEKRYEKEIVEEKISLGNLCYKYGDYGKAAKQLEQALKIIEKGSDKPKKASVMTQLGMLFTKIAKFNDAKTYLQKALKIYEQDNSYGAYHLMTVNTMKYLGDLWYSIAKYTDNTAAYLTAEKYYKQVFNIYTERYPKKLYEKAEMMTKLAAVLSRRGDHEKALDKQKKSQEYYKKADKKFRKALEVVKIDGCTDKRLLRATIKEAFGNSLTNRGAFKEAEPYLQDAFKAMKDYYGNFHPSTANLRIDIGIVSFSQHRFKKAYKHYSDALRSIPKEQNYQKAFASIGMGNALVKRSLQKPTHRDDNTDWQKNYIDAEKALTEALEFYNKEYGNQSIKTAGVRDPLGSVQVALQKYKEAKRHLKAVLKTRLVHPAYGVNHFKTVKALEDLTILNKKEGDRYKKMREDDKASVSYREGLTYFIIYNVMPVSDTKKLRKIQCKLLRNEGIMLMRQGKYEFSLCLLEDSLKLSKDIYGEKSRKTGKVQRILGKNFLKLASKATPKDKDKYYKCSEDALNNVLDIFKESGANHKEKARANVYLAYAFYRQGQYKKAYKHLKEALLPYELHFGKNSFENAQVRDLQVSLLGKLPQKKSSNHSLITEQKQYLKEALEIRQACCAFNQYETVRTRVNVLLVKIKLNLHKTDATAIAMKKLADRLVRQGRCSRPLYFCSRAVYFYKEAKKIFEKSDAYGPNHLKTVETMTILGNTLIELGLERCKQQDKKVAEKYYKRAKRYLANVLPIYISRHSKNYFKIAESQENMANVLKLLGDKRQEETYLKAAEKSYQTHFNNEDSIQIARVRKALQELQHLSLADGSSATEERIDSVTIYPDKDVACNVQSTPPPPNSSLN